jgi:hypothetical protein
MANFRMAEVLWGGKKILQVVADDELLRGTKMQELFDIYQTADQIVFIEFPNRGMHMHLRNGELMERFNKEIDTSRLRYGPVQSI